MTHGRGLACVVRVQDPGEQEHNRTDGGEARAPREDERKPLCRSVIGAEQEHDGDDRHREDRDRDCQRQHVP